jgi:hypothetical protein
MFEHQTILALRLSGSEGASALPIFGHFRDYHFARNVMEVKQHLLRCLRRAHQPHVRTPDVILVDAGHHNIDIKTELERWMEEHPRLPRIKIRFPAPRPWVVRLWERLNRFTRR